MKENESFGTKFKNHLSNNKGKYLTAAAVPAAIKIGSTGVLGTKVQDTIQDTAGTLARDLEASAQYDKAKGDLDAGIAVYKKGDNILTNDAESNQRLLTADRILQKENIPYLAKMGTSKLAERLTGLNNKQDDTNFIVRNPLTELGFRKDIAKNTVSGATDAIVDH